MNKGHGEMVSCEGKRRLALLTMMFATYSLVGAVMEHTNTNLHYPLLTLWNPQRYPKREKLQVNPILTGFPFWGLGLLLMWKANQVIERKFFPTQSDQKSAAKLIFDFCFWSVLITFAEYIFGRCTSGKKAWTKKGNLRSYDYSYMKYSHKNVIALPISVGFGVFAAAFFQINPYVIRLFQRGIDGTICQK